MRPLNAIGRLLSRRQHSSTVSRSVLGSSQRYFEWLERRAMPAADVAVTACITCEVAKENAPVQQLESTLPAGQPVAGQAIAIDPSSTTPATNVVAQELSCASPLPTGNWLESTGASVPAPLADAVMAQNSTIGSPNSLSVGQPQPPEATGEWLDNNAYRLDAMLQDENGGMADYDHDGSAGGQDWLACCSNGYGDGGYGGEGGEGGYGGYGDPPTISDFTVLPPVDNHWSFTGTVTDDCDPTHCWVIFGGLLDGYAAQVTSTGSFTLTIGFYPGSGFVTAQATDCEGLDSNIAVVYV